MKEDGPVRKKQKKLHDAALSGVNWAKQHEIEQQIHKDSVAAANVSVVKSILHEDEDGAIEKPDNVKVTQAMIKNAINSKNVMKISAQIVFGKPGKRTSMGPYKAYVARNGAHLLVTGKAGHMKLLDLMGDKIDKPAVIRQKPGYKDLWHDRMCLNQTIRDACFLSSHEMTAVATKSAVNIYSDTGHDLHRLQVLGTVVKMNYLPYHFLLASVDIHGSLTYTDMGASGGDVVCKKKNIVKGEARCMATNPYNAVVSIGSSNGSVQMFTPNEDKPVVNMFCQHGGVRKLAFSIDGKQMVTTSDQGIIKIWDSRKTFEPIASYKTGPGRCQHLAISQNGHIAVAGGNNVLVWDSQMLMGLPVKEPLLTHHFTRGNDVHSLCFRPFYDILYCGSENCVNPLIVPGSGIATVDTTSELNPYISTKARRNLLVKQLLEKIPHDSITLFPESFGDINENLEVPSASTEDQSDYSDDESSSSGYSDSVSENDN